MSFMSRLTSIEADLESKAGHVRDVEYWGKPYGTPIAPGMKPEPMEVATPKKRTRVATPDAPTHEGAKLHPPYPDDADQKYRETYEKRTSIPPRDSGKYKGVTAQEMWDNWLPDRERFRKPYPEEGDDKRSRPDKKTSQAVVDYTGSEYEYMNGLLRMDDVAVADLSSDEVKQSAQAIKDMDRAMRPIGEDIVVHRSTSSEFFKDLAIGSQFRDRGYSSTTVLEGYLDEVREDLYGGRDQTTLEIRVPADTKALYAPSFQRYRNRDADIGEGELVLERGTEFRVVEHHGNKLVLEVVLPGSAGATEHEDLLDSYAQALMKLKREEEGEWDDEKSLPVGDEESSTAQRFVWRDGDVEITKEDED
ncbi:VIP2-like ADP-ribosyltransferase toxin [Gordonia phage Kabocha]|nr:VIP2-like ADP-ribosyltransferase toxin [Gordonia phage Kabocha]WAA20004.1 VIP2-like ADP-ribosyltransferase toxin [Gordonia phage Hanem]WNM67046.1 ADP-ribosyltransferase [Gordonia Phage Schomber]